MSKLFETLGMEWCLSKITNSAKTNILIKKAKKKRKRKRKRRESNKKNVPTKNHHEPTMEPLSSL